MSKPKQAVLPLKKGKNSFILSLNRNVYKGEIIKKAVSEDKDWVKKISTSDEDYICLQLKTSDKQDVFNWFNYLVFLHRN